MEQRINETGYRLIKLGVTPERMAELAKMIDMDVVSPTTGKLILIRMIKNEINMGNNASPD